MGVTYNELYDDCPHSWIWIVGIEGEAQPDWETNVVVQWREAKFPPPLRRYGFMKPFTYAYI